MPGSTTGPGISFKGRVDAGVKLLRIHCNEFENVSVTSTMQADARASCPRRWQIFRGGIFWRNWDTRRRDLLQHRHDRVPGGADRSFISRTDCGDDLSADRKLWNQLARSGKPLSTRARIRHRRTK